MTATPSSSGTLKYKLFQWAWKIAAAIIALFLLLILLVYLGLFGKIPSTDNLKQIDNLSGSLVYSIDGKIMGSYYEENRNTIGNKDISKHLKNALIATEDSRFFEHNGIDIISLGRVILKTVFMGDLSQGGGSTISQQLAKNLYPRKNYGPLTLVVNKIRELFIANRLEKAFTKEEILTMYLNTVPFGEELYGIEAASLRFFGKRSRNLDASESAVLIGMLAANTAYNPRLNPEKSKTRRNVVLKRMVEQKFTTKAEEAKFRNEPIKLNYNRIDHNTGIAPYFREIIRKKVEKILSDKYGDEYDLYTDGLKVYTSIDSRIQNYAELALNKHMITLQKEFNEHWKKKDPWAANPSIYKNAVKQSGRYIEYKSQGLSDAEIMAKLKQKVRMNILTTEGQVVVDMSPLDSVKHYLKMLNVGFVAMDSRNGQILAWVGGVNHRAFQYDHVTSKRQVGSTFKPFLYAAAILDGVEPCDFIPNQKVVFEDYDDWSPSNSDDKYDGYYSLKGGLANSVNTIAAQLMMRTGPEKVVDLAENMGITAKIPEYPSIALGAVDISLYDMVKSYAPFINGGYRITPIDLLKIEDKNGKLLYQQKLTTAKTQVLDPDAAQLMIELMKGVVDNGTGHSLRSVYGITGDVGGKTGTTQDNTDGWFIGCTPGMVAGAWVGNDNPAIRFRTTALGQGAHTALPIYGGFVSQIERDPRFLKYAGGSFAPLPDYLQERLTCDFFSLTDDSKKGFIEKIFSPNDKAPQAQPKASTPSATPKPSTDKKTNLLDKMKDLFN